ncbi:uncharacterized protein LACBIDRAFT_148470, partial [Laccaria bicolor S238N-H82]
LSLINNGSVARDHLASERTFLAYVRTSLGIAPSGIALMQFFNLGTKVRRFSQPLGAITIAMAFAVLVLGNSTTPLELRDAHLKFVVQLTGIRRYFSIQKELPHGRFPVSKVGIALMSFMLGSLITATFGMLVTDR